MQDLTQAQGVSEDEVRIATEELKRSTAAINQHTEILKVQAQALDRAVQKKSGNDRRRQDLEIVQRRKLDNEHKQLAGEVQWTTPQIVANADAIAAGEHVVRNRAST